MKPTMKMKKIMSDAFSGKHVKHIEWFSIENACFTSVSQEHDHVKHFSWECQNVSHVSQSFTNDSRLVKQGVFIGENSKNIGLFHVFHTKNTHRELFSKSGKDEFLTERFCRGQIE